MTLGSEFADEHGAVGVSKSWKMSTRSRKVDNREGDDAGEGPASG